MCISALHPCPSLDVRASFHHLSGVATCSAAPLREGPLASPFGERPLREPGSRILPRCARSRAAAVAPSSRSRWSLARPSWRLNAGLLVCWPAGQTLALAKRWPPGRRRYKYHASLATTSFLLERAGLVSLTKRSAPFTLKAYTCGWRLMRSLVVSYFRISERGSYADIFSLPLP
jgi:hypothetical protein